MQYQNKEDEKERKKRLSVDSAAANIQSPNLTGICLKIMLN